jgi:hypothetical protein
MLKSAVTYLSTTDATALPTGAQSRCLRELERADAIETIARARLLEAFTAAQGHCEDAAYSPRSWLVHRTRITRAAANCHQAWVERRKAHPRVAAAMADGGDLSESFGRAICGWTDMLPEDARDRADEILVEWALYGLSLRELSSLAAAMHASTAPPDGQDDPGAALEDRSVRLETTFQGAGVLTGNLTPGCAAVLGTVLDALAAPKGAGDTRTKAQRYHDALQEAMRRLVAADLVPDRAGQPSKVLAHIDLSNLIDLDTDSALMTEWTTRVHAQWAAARAAASVSGSDGGAWLEGRAAEGFACDSSITPVVTGEIYPAALDTLVHLCLELSGHGPGHCTPTRTGTESCGPETCGSESCGADADPADVQADPVPGRDQPAPGQDPTGPRPPTGRGRAALEQAIIRQAITLVSGPGGLASTLRRGLLDTRLAGPSLPLDIGVSRDIPAAIRRAVTLRDQHCRFPTGCDQPAAACEVHHLTHKANGGKTSIQDCALFCFYHHHVVIHEQGWTVALNPDGTTTAWNPAKTRTYHSHNHGHTHTDGHGHSPPTARAG